MRYFLFILVLFLCNIANAQSEQLAKNYLKQGEYEKAETIYKKLYKNAPNRMNYILGLVETYQQLVKFDEGEKILKKAIKENPKNAQLLVELGHHFEVQSKPELAKQQYNLALESYENNALTRAYTLAQTFEKYNLLDQAAIVYEKGMVDNPGSNFNMQLAKIYGEQGKLEKMFNSYLSLIKRQPNYTNIVKRNFNSFLSEDSSKDANLIFKKLLIKKLQQDPDILYNEMLSWLFVQQKDFQKAFIQEKAIFKRQDKGVDRIIDLARVAISEKQIDTAIDILSYVLEVPSSNELKLTAQKLILKTSVENAEKKEYKSIQEAYEEAFVTYGRSKETISLQTDYAHFIAFKLNQKKEAISLLKSLLKKERLSRFQIARVKMKIADILILDHKFNQALIYYTQVQNTLKNNFLAQDARFKIAQTSYFKGDFKWAETQLDVLKSSATQLIANDAMELSLIIKDNSLEDSTQTALKIFAKADLLALQNKDEEAIATYQKILDNHRGEKIEDETFLRQAALYEKNNEYEKAKINYLKIIEFYAEDILIDEACYKLAELYRTKLSLPDKAKALYEKIIFNYTDSIYYVDARKKYRALRGDAIN